MAGGGSLEEIIWAQEKIYLLLNSGNYFKKLCADPDTRAWLETVIKHVWNVYMVVGIHTVHESSIRVDDLEHRVQGSFVLRESIYL
jgi:hypothetical protein